MLRVAIATVLLFVWQTASYGYQGCYYNDLDGSDPGLPLAEVSEIDVYTTDAFYSNAIGSPAFSSAERDDMVRSFLYNFQWQSGHATHYNWKGNVNNPELGRHVTISDCDATPYSFDKPILVINADSTTCSGATTLACAWVEVYPVNGGPDVMNCSRVTFHSPNAASFVDAHTVKRYFGHEVLHTWKMPHQNTAGNCNQNLTDVCLICDGTASVNTDFLTRADRYYIRADRGYASFSVIENHGSGFPPGSWMATIPTGTGTHSGARTTDSDDADSAYIYNIVTGGQPEVRVLTVESNSWSEEDPTNWDSYYLPDVGKTVNQATERWFVAFFSGDGETTTDKDVEIFERNVGAGTWTESYLNTNALLPHVAITYDPVSDKVVIMIERDGGLRFYTRDRSGGSWVYTQFTIDTYDGADMACSKYNSAPSTEDNCVVVYVNTAPTGSLKFRRMSVAGNGAVSLGSEYSGGYVGYSRPSVTVNPVNADPQFLFSFNQGGATTYVRKMDRGSTTWSGTGVTSFTAGSADWMGPGSLGVFRAGSSTYTDLMANED